MAYCWGAEAGMVSSNSSSSEGWTACVRLLLLVLLSGIRLLLLAQSKYWELAYRETETGLNIKFTLIILLLSACTHKVLVI